MQSLSVISINLWDTLISLANLLILFLIIKKFLFKPVQKMLAKRQSDIDEIYSLANDAKSDAERDKAYWEEKREDALKEADAIMKNATEKANRRGDKIVNDAKDKADDIIRQAETEADLERKKAYDGIKREIVDVSALLAEKMISREISVDDHRGLIDSFIEKIGDENDADE